LRNVLLKARYGKQGKEFVKWAGDLLYTHKGISGPTVLGISREVAERMVDGDLATPPYLEADLDPAISFEDLRANIRDEGLRLPRRTLGGIVSSFLPARLQPTVFELSGTIPDQRVSQTTAKQLTRIVSLIKEWPLGTPSSVPLERGEVVAGGITLDEVDPQTMESKKIAHLYLCGEVLDLAGPVGGYNLQAAWSTGYVAGESA
jgi:predicted Rossmann fold flavoprotein